MKTYEVTVELSVDDPGGFFTVMSENEAAEVKQFIYNILYDFDEIHIEMVDAREI